METNDTDNKLNIAIKELDIAVNECLRREYIKFVKITKYECDWAREYVPDKVFDCMDAVMRELEHPDYDQIRDDIKTCLDTMNEQIVQVYNCIKIIRQIKGIWETHLETSI